MIEEASPPRAMAARPPAAIRRLAGVAPAIVFVVLVVLLVPALTNAYWLKVFTTVAIYAVAALGAGLLYGRLGLVSLGQIALLGVGAWVTLRLGHATALPFAVLLLIAGAVTCLIGTVVGLPSLRISGLNLAIVTLMFAGAFEVVFFATGFPDGGEGFLGKATDNVREPLQRPALGTEDAAFFRYTVVAGALLFALAHLHLRRRPGRAWAAIRQSEAGALASGINVTLYKLWALALVAFSSGVAGGLLAANTGFLNPISFRASESIVLFAVVLIGGAFGLAGAVIAGLFSQAVPALLDELSVNGNLILVIFGAGLIHALATAPRGIAGQLEDLIRWARGRGARDR